MENLKRTFYHIEQFTRLIFHTTVNFAAFFRYPRETLNQMNFLGYSSLMLVLTAALFIGLVLSLEWGKKLELFGAKLLMGRIMSLSVIREIGPLITGLMLSGRIGARVAAELGSMKISEQLDAMRVMGADPVRRLVVPRIAATIMMTVPLVIYADTIALLGGWVSATLWLNTDSAHYWISALDGVFFRDLTMGLIKPFFFGYTIAIVSCYYGLSTYGGAEGVGRSATRAVMACSLSILFMDFLISKTVLALYGT